MEVNEQDLEHAVCVGDFWSMAERAVSEAHGNPRTVLGPKEGVMPGRTIANLSVRAMAELLAPNGIRLVYDPSKVIK